MKPYLKAQSIPLVGLQDRRRRLTDKQREEIRELYAKGDIGTRRLAAMFGVSRSLVMLIVSPERAQAVRDRFKAHWRDYAKETRQGVPCRISSQHTQLQVQDLQGKPRQKGADT